MKIFLMIVMILSFSLTVSAQPQDDSFLKNVSPQEIKIDGYKVHFPISYGDSFQMSASFPVAADRVRKLLPKELNLVLIGPNTTLIVLAAMEFRRPLALPPYKEFGILFPVMYNPPGAPGLSGNYVLHLPVDNAQACRSGIRLYGLPKFMAQITFRDAPDGRICEVASDNKKIVTFYVKKLKGSLQTMENFCYAVKQKRLIRYRVKSRGYWNITSGDGSWFRWGNHAIAQQMKKMQITPKCVAYYYAEHFQNLLYPPKFITASNKK